VGTNQLDKAEATLRDAVQKHPENDAAETNLIDFLVEKRNVEVAIAELLPMIEKKPDAYALKFKLASLQLSNKQADKAEATMKQVIEQDKLGPNGITARNKLAGYYAASKRVDEAKALIKEVLDANPRDAEALTLRGQFALAENKIPDAIGDFRSVSVDQPNNVNVLKLLATAHLRNNEPELAGE
jgi:predicted Zn-dependent protease